jgi:hypothetical protein
MSGLMASGGAEGTGLMGFFIRTGIVAAIGIMLIPADPDEIARSGEAAKASALSTLVFAKAAYDDASGFCGRNPDACTTGAALADSFGAKARTGAKWVYGYFSPDPIATGPGHAPPTRATALPDPIATGSLATRTEVLPVPARKPRPSAT